ncbi:beta-1,3-galactosyl-O-glycosyl-glycoprotein beta-1,6-N-acetylglucosaminyltransferase 3-like [Mytilus californianus]|uniref:beta-1,3-galactosyl-O-glycosyl-glycoprotein beta-1,6-N-acetylglucosaminyltransferase 3-like n=1 Tax=Mytilus californianus TaxID=6549 RepID=UPI002248303F|nr:beta-1,3-galactosyl-O-glycosyl-glycoprotein beta-1,6-N-acetylglucosaminyltransferase 3-like [Mytilus californianus]
MMTRLISQFRRSYKLIIFLMLILTIIKCFDIYTIIFGNNKTDNEHWTRVPKFRGRNEVSCKKLIERDSTEIILAYSHMHKYGYRISPDKYFTYLSTNCSLLNDFMFNYKFPITEEELKFPIAFIILMYKDVEQVVRLLRAIYRPQNHYCIHVDLSAPEETHLAVDSIARCYNNIFVVSKKVDIIYGHISRLNAEINCMSDFVRRSNSWKYVLNIPSQQYPLKTNAEIVKILTKFNGSNIVEGIINQSRTIKDRYQNRFFAFRNDLHRYGKKTPFHNKNIAIVKGLAIGAFSYNFVRFVLESDVAKELLIWMKDIYSPDEYYWATLNYNAAIPAPGRYIGS